MTVHLIHGFNVSDGGRDTVRRWAHWFADVMVHDYGWTGLIGLRCTNAQAVKQIARHVKPGDTLIGHSNGALICLQVARRTRPGAVVVVNPAMRRDARWPDKLPVLCLYSSSDWVVQLGRVWARGVDTVYGSVAPLLLESVATGSGALFRSAFRFKPHGWGAAGRYGFTSNQPGVTSWDMAEDWWGEPVHSHSGAFKGRAGDYWGLMVAKWVRWV